MITGQKKYNEIVAYYFSNKPLYLDLVEKKPNIRKVIELPWQQSKAGRAELAATLLDYNFIEAKLIVSGINLLIKDYDLINRNTVQQKIKFSEKSLKLIQGALRLATSVLERDISQLPSQLIGRLITFENPEIKVFLEQIKKCRKEPRLCPIMPSLTSPGGPLMSTLRGHTDPVQTVAVTPDCTRIISGSRDETIKVWDIETGILIRTLGESTEWSNVVDDETYDLRERPNVSKSQLLKQMKGHAAHWVNTVAVTPDGRLVLSGSSEDKTIKVWELETGKELNPLVGHSASVAAITITLNGRYAISASFDKTLKVWDLQNQQELRTLQGHSGYVETVVVTTDNRYLISGSYDHTIKIWDFETGKELQNLIGHSESVNAIIITTNNKYVISASSDKTLKVWDMKTGEEILTLRGHTDSVTAVAVTPDNQFIISGSHDGTIKIWDINKGLDLRTLSGRYTWVNSIAVMPNGLHVISGSNDSTIKIWNLENNSKIQTLPGHSAEVWAFAITPDNCKAISGSDDNSIKIWDLETGNELQTLLGHTNLITDIAITPDGRRLISGSGDKTIKIWDIESGLLLHTLEGHHEWVNRLAITPDGKHLFSSSRNLTVEMWDIETGINLRSFSGHERGINEIAISSDGSHVISGSYDYSNKVWNIKSGIIQFTILGFGADHGLHKGRVLSTTYTQNGNVLVAGTQDFSINVLNIDVGTDLQNLIGHTDRINVLTITPDSKIIISGSDDKTIKLWDMENCTEVKTIVSNTHEVESIVVTPDSYYFISCFSNDNTLEVRDVKSGNIIMSFSGESSFTTFCVTSDGRTIIVGEVSGRIHILRLENLLSGPSIVTAWRSQVSIKNNKIAFGCPHCRTWSEISSSSLGTEILCPQCGKSIKLNPFTIYADWRPVVKAWKEKGKSIFSKLNFTFLTKKLKQSTENKI